MEEKHLKELLKNMDKQYAELENKYYKQKEVIEKIKKEVDKIFKEYQPFNRAVLLTMLEKINNYIKEV